MDSFRDEVWKILMAMGAKIQMKYDSILPDAFPVPKKEYLFPNCDKETWDDLIRVYVTALEVLRGQVIFELVNPLPKTPPWMRKNPDTGLFENVYE
jgi:hypothetical protein